MYGTLALNVEIAGAPGETAECVFNKTQPADQQIRLFCEANDLWEQAAKFHFILKQPKCEMPFRSQGSDYEPAILLQWSFGWTGTGARHAGKSIAQLAGTIEKSEALLKKILSAAGTLPGADSATDSNEAKGPYAKDIAKDPSEEDITKDSNEAKGSNEEGIAKDSEEAKDPSEGGTAKEPNGAKDSNGGDIAKDANEAKDSSEGDTAKVPNEAKGAEEAKGSKEAKGPNEAKGSTEGHIAKDSNDAERQRERVGLIKEWCRKKAAEKKFKAMEKRAARKFQ